MFARQLTRIASKVAQKVGVDVRFQGSQRGSLKGIVTCCENPNVTLERARCVDDGRA